MRKKNSRSLVPNTYAYGKKPKKKVLEVKKREKNRIAKARKQINNINGLSILSLSEKDNPRNTETPGKSLTFNSTIHLLTAGQHQHP